jgi:hypothetical protein
VTDTPSPSSEAPSSAPVTPAAPVAASPPTPASPAGTTPTPATPAPPPAAAAPTRPDYIPEAHWDPTANKVRDEAALSAHFNQILARDAAAQSKALALPANAESYKVELPADFKAPEGVTFAFNDADPLLAQARTLAHELGIPQEGFSKLLGLYAGTQVQTQQQVVAAKNAEVAKLGASGPARIDALDTFFKAYLGEAEGKQLLSRAFTASDVQILEKMVGKISGQGASSFKRNGGEPPQQAGKVSQEEYDRMTPGQRWDYSRSHDQSQFRTVPGGRQ